MVGVSQTRNMAGNMLYLFLCMLLLGPVRAVPSIVSFDKVKVLLETASTNTILSKIDCTDDGGLPTNTVIDNINPTSPCGGCFEVLTCETNECLEYRAGIGTLSASSASSYEITISCDNGIDTPVTEVILVIIDPNRPPYFEPETLFVKTQNSGYARLITSGTSIYQVDAKDDDPSDTIEYFLKTHPMEYDTMFTIGSSDGIIRPTVDMATVCIGELTFQVTVYDGKTVVGPKIVVYTLVVPNVAPTISNLNNEIHIPEGATGTIFTMRVIDRNPLTPSYTYSSTNAAGLAQYTIDGSSTNIGVASALDYENPNLRETDIQIVYTDGSCSSETYNLRLVVKDINEDPVISPVTSSFQVCEGQQFFDPGLTLTDEDVGDTARWTLHSTMANPDGFFNIEPNSGIFIVNPGYDVDQNVRTPNVRYIVQAEDSGGLTATATVNVEFLDCNDNAPVFNEPFYDFTTTACAAGGTTLGTVAASDDDSNRENNNVITYSGSGGAVSVDNAGAVILQSALAAGSVLTFNALATDQGQTPGPLTSVEAARVSIIFTECPTTPPPVTAAPTTAAPTTVAATAATLAPNSASLDAELPWIILAAILGAIFLGLLSFMCWKFGSLLRCPSCKKPMCNNPCKQKPRPRKIEQRPPRQRPDSAASVPPVEEPLPGFIYGFWKLRYPNDDTKQPTDNKVLPETGNLEPVYPHTIDEVGGSEPSSSPQPQKPKRKCCIIL